MQLLCNVYLLIFLSIRSGSFSPHVNGFDRTELEYLSFRLNPLECIRLVNTMTVSMKYTTERLTTRILRRYLDNNGATRQDCLVRLENWNNNFLGANTLFGRLSKIHKIVNNNNNDNLLNVTRLLISLKKGENNGGIRETMDVTLRMLGRLDLAKYLTRDRKTKSLNNFNTNNDISEGQWHPISKRSPYKNVDEILLSKKKENDELKKENCTGEAREVHHNDASPAEAKMLPEKNESNEINKDQEPPDTKEHSKTMQWLNIFILLSLLLIVTCALLLCITRKRKRKKMLSARSNSDGYNCTCTCSDVDVESGSMKDYPKYRRVRTIDRERSRILQKKKRKERTKDRDLLESCIKKNTKAKEPRKKHKSKRKSVRTKDLDRTKLDRKKLRSNMIGDYKNYPVCDCCKCIADYK